MTTVRWLLVLAGSIVIVCAAVCLGDPAFWPWQLPAVLNGPDSLERIVLYEVRIPRTLLGLLAGAGIGAAGLLLQESLRNRLAVPELLGVAPGAALTVAVIEVFAIPVGSGVKPLLALAGALAGGLVTLLATLRIRTADGVLLAGAGISAALSAGLIATMGAAEEFQAQSLFRYLAGDLSGANWDSSGAMLGWFAVLLPLCLLLAPGLSVLRMGDAAATSVGAGVTRIRLLSLAMAALLVAAAVTACGPLAWVGLIAPTLSRTLRPHGGSAGWLLTSMGFGAVVTVAADLVARLLFSPLETPVGAWTAGIGLVLLLATVVARRRPRPGADVGTAPPAVLSTTPSAARPTTLPAAAAPVTR